MPAHKRSTMSYNPPAGPSEFDILKASHKFLREEQDGSTNSWNDQLAEKYYANLYREFAVCDLKHFKSGNFALRWRTEDEVLSGAGETTCANTRCEYHHQEPNQPRVALSTLELPFAYEEHGESKSALVKMVLCDRCVRKLMWKRNKDRERAIKLEKDLDRKRKSAQDNGSGEDGRRKEPEVPSEDHEHHRKRHRYQNDEDHNRS
ncbi:hypothetical protein AX14_001194 [Amanita brunnescens Koide BX004]|nr:hypothetical protein AX14_001194 [Amanita brunnescens Koide BX004]